MTPTSHDVSDGEERNESIVTGKGGGDGRGLFQPIKLGRTSRTDVRLLTSVVDVELATDLLENHRLVYSSREGRRTNYWTNLITFTDRTYVLSEDLISETAFL